MAWLTNWNYRKPITISNSGSALINYQIQITIDTEALVTAGKLLSSCNDIRFTSSDGSTLLNYWIESGCNTTSTNIWVKVPSIVTGSNTIYFYYNNTGALLASNGTDTFDFFDDFSGDLSKWNVNSGSAVISGGILTLTGATNIVSKTTVPFPSIFMSRYSTGDVNWMGATDSNTIATPAGYISNAIHLYTHTGNNDRSFIDTYKDGVFYEVGCGGGWLNYHTSELIWSTNSAVWKRDGASFCSSVNSIPNINLYPFLAALRSYSVMLVDYIYVHKYASPEPTISAIGTEEVIPANITATLMTVTPSESPCRTGICTVTVDVTWTNTGGTSGTFVPNITVDTITIDPPPYLSQALGTGTSVTKSFILSGLTSGTHAICPYPN